MFLGRLAKFLSTAASIYILLLFLIIIPASAAAITSFEQPAIDNQPQALITGKAKAINQTLTAKEKKWIKQHPKLIVGAEHDWAPFDFVNAEGQYNGVAYDYLSLIAEKTGLKFEIKLGIWNDLLDKIRNRQIDILPAAFYSKERASYVNFTSAYFQALDYFFIRSDLDIKSLDDLDGKRVAIPKNYVYAEHLRLAFPKVIIVNVDTFTAAIDAVLENRADMLYDTYASISYALKKEGVNTIIPFKSARELDSHPIHMISRNDQPELAAILQKALNSISAQEKQTIYNRWIGFEAPVEKQNLNLSSEQQTWLSKHPLIKLGSEAEWPPYEFVDQTGKFQGLSADVIHLLEQRLGIHFEITSRYPWSTTLAKVKNHEIDMVSSVVKTPDREQFLNFSMPFVSPPSVVYTRKDVADISRLDDLNGKIVVVENAYYLHERIAKDYPAIQLLVVDTTTEALKALSFAKADAYIGNQGVANWIIEQNAYTNLRINHASSFDKGDLCFGIRKDWPLLPEIINKALESISADEMLTIRRKWLGVSPDQQGLNLSATERAWLDAHKLIHFTGNPNRLPYEAFTDKAEYAGMVSDYLRLIQQRLGITIQIEKSKTWQESLQKFKNGHIDLLSQTLDSSALSTLKYTQTYLSSPVVIVMRDDEKFIENLAQIQHKKIGVIKDYDYVNTITRQYPNIDFYAVTSIQEGLSLVSSGKIDAFLEAVAPVSYQITELGIHNIRIVGKTEFNAPLVLAVSENYLPLIPLLNRALNDITPAEKQKIHNIWTGKQAVTVLTDYSLLAKIAGALILLNAIFFYWNRKLKNEVQKRLASECEVRLLNERFALATELVSLGVWQWDYSASNSFVFDERMFEMYQIPPQARVSFTEWISKIHPDDRHLIENLPHLADQQHLEFRILRADGQIRYIYAGSTRVVDESSGHIKVFGVNWDITERKQADAQFKAIIDGLPLTVLIADNNGLILLDNPQAKREIADHTSIIGRNTSEFYADPLEKGKILDILHTQGSITQRQVRYKISADETIDCLLSIMPIHYKEQHAWLAVIINLTARIKMEQDLAEAKNQAERANHAKSAFLANMSHEIRTPMNAILGFTELLNERIQDPHLKSYVKTIHNAGYTLLTLINDILDLSKIEAGKMSIQKTAVNPHEMFTELGHIFMMALRKKNLDLILEIDANIPDSLMLDLTRLRQVLFNLIGNAVKFTEQGYIRVRAKTANENPIRSHLDLLIEIEDTGIGIPGNEQESVFSEFTQLDSPDQQSGTGLGLSISRRLVELMGGSISIKSQPGHGSTFTVRLNQVDVAAIKVTPSSRFNHSTPAEILFRPATVLVVDDIENNRRLIRENFIGSQVSLLEAENGLEAIAVAELQDIHLILMDIRMPVMDGYQAAKAIKAFKQVPIIALTASVMQDDFERIQSDHFDAYLKKPILRQELVACLSQFLPHQVNEPEPLQNKNVSLTEAELLVLPMVLQQLHQQQDNWKTIQDSNNISAMKRFAANLLKIADEYDFTPLQDYANNLQDCIGHFDIDGITTLLREFPDFQKSLQVAQTVSP
ncbi:transporter substrate-binding domain-containing protein [Methylomonas sp. AM2-LC]|uniref:transporter substrate-binding domain-containing protein n=1 Tax=Methylomonas sp. AM2-LC TaxID=3153301 RepID=UPI0032675D49